jgi:hypothetical protein
VYFHIFPTRFECIFTSSPPVSSVFFFEQKRQFDSAKRSLEKQLVLEQQRSRELIVQLEEYKTEKMKNSEKISSVVCEKTTLETGGEDLKKVRDNKTIGEDIQKGWFECSFKSSPLVSSVFLHLLHSFRV